MNGKVELERVKRLLTEMISSLCKSGLDYNSTLTVQGLLGITIDHENVLLINLNESYDKPDSSPGKHLLQSHSSITETRKSGIKTEQLALKRLKSSDFSVSSIKHGLAEEITPEKPIITTRDGASNGKTVVNDVIQQSCSSNGYQTTTAVKPVNCSSWTVESGKEVVNDQSPIHIAAYWSMTTQIKEEDNLIDFVSLSSDELPTVALVDNTASSDECRVNESFKDLASHKRHQHSKKKPQIKRVKNKNCSEEFGETFIRQKRARGATAASSSYTCVDCAKSFPAHCQLLVHRRVHTGERPFVCSTCCKAFTQIGNLQIHQRIHTGEKPYSCGVCDQAFTQLSQLNQHMHHHPGETPYQCPKCCKTFVLASQMCKHKCNALYM